MHEFSWRVVKTSDTTYPYQCFSRLRRFDYVRFLDRKSAQLRADNLNEVEKWDIYNPPDVVKRFVENGTALSEEYLNELLLNQYKSATDE
jgi:8-oxo-dGTP pyrophosphatase MutT (NUDIX family)